MTFIFMKSFQTANNGNISIQDTRMHSVCCCCIPIWRRSPLEKGPLIDLFLRSLGSTSGRVWPKSLNACAGPWLLHPYQVWSTSINRSCRKGYVFPYIYTTQKKFRITYYIIFVHTILNSRSYAWRDRNSMKLSRLHQWACESTSTNFQDDLTASLENPKNRIFPKILR